MARRDTPPSARVDGPPQKRGPIAWMAGNSVAANLIMLACLIGGFLMLGRIKQEVFPDFEINAVIVTVAYPGASPEEVESGVVLAIEEAVQGLEGVDEVRSTAGEGFAEVTVELLNTADLQKLAADIESEVDRITTFPEEAEDPEIRTVSLGRQVLTLALHGETTLRALHRLGEQMRDELLADPRITRVDLTGVPDPEIAVEVSQEQLRRYGLTRQQIADRVTTAALDVPAGGIDTEGGEVLMRIKERRDFGRQFARIPIVSTATGGEVLLGDIATVTDGFEDTDRYALFNGEPTVLLNVFRVGEQTPMDVSEAVNAKLDDLRPSLPAGVKVAVLNDRSEHYADRIRLLVKNGAIGLVLVLCVLGLFLEARLAFWVMMGIPISFLGSFLVLPATGVSINMISLFAYIIALGIVVDDAIVVGENVYHYHQEGMKFIPAAVRGAREVAMPVTFSILTNIAAFLPIYFVPGVTGDIFRIIPIVVCTVFLVSLFESLFVLPAHLGHHRPRQRHGVNRWLHARQQAFSIAFRRWTRRRYGTWLDAALRHRYLTFAAAAGVLIVMSAYALSGRMGFEQFPAVESDRAVARVTLPFGKPVERTEAVVRRLERGARRVIAASGHPELMESIVTDVGAGGSHKAVVQAHLADPEIRDEVMGTAEFTRRWREAVGEITGVESVQFISDAGGPGGRERPITIELGHSNMDVLEEVSGKLADVLETYPRVRDVDDGFQPGKRQLDVTVTREGESLGLTAREIGRQVRSAFYGAEAIRQQRGRNELKVMVRLPERERSTEQTVDDLLIYTPAGTYVPLREVADVRRGRAYKTIDRRQGRRVVQVTADITPRAKAGEVLADLGSGALATLTRDYRGLSYSFEGQRAEIRESMDSLKVSFPLAMLAIYGLLAVPFRSYVQPLIVMIAIPFGVIGAFLGHLVMGYSLSVLSMFGIVALAGVVVNDSLVLVTFANRRRREQGDTLHDAIREAGIQRFRPVVLTTLTTFGGLAPMIFETSLQARFLIPMAISLGFGILLATGITLVLVPSLYLAVEDVKRGGAKLRALLGRGADSSAGTVAARGLPGETS
ncbi:MAG: efflux RND transporter permease subunit [Phycisphaerae bacterium]|nr:efflux RND transporter permease subunit [Phycisphaerae bacterium]